jgi:phosphate-selective porin OprO/OprP
MTRAFPTPSALALAIALAAVAPSSARAQAPETEGPPPPGAFEGSAPPPRPGALLPEPSESTYRANRVETSWFTMKPGLVMLGDYTFFSQDAESLAQVGEQRDRGQLRASRVMLRGKVGTDYAVRYLIAGEYKGFDVSADKDWEMTDVSLTFPMRGPDTTLTVGKTKQTFGYEMVGDAANLAFQERVLSPFFVSRAIGAKLSHVTADRLSTISAGIYNDGWAGSSGSGPNDGTDVTARVTRALWLEDGGRRLLHLGLAIRRAGADGGTLRYRGRPESNVADFFVDTGKFAADHATHVGLEGIWQNGPWSVIGEYVRAKVDAPTVGDPTFSGGYLGVSWVVTGEHRPYDTSVGYLRRVMPATANGAVELVARMSKVDLDDAAIRGGSFTKTYAGANWWVTPRWKLGAGWGRTWLDDAGLRGVTDAVLMRVQWVY